MAGKSEKGRLERISKAKLVCLYCPVRQQCLDWAVENNQEFGVWGSMTERERKILRRKMITAGASTMEEYRRLTVDDDW